MTGPSLYNAQFGRSDREVPVALIRVISSILIVAAGISSSLVAQPNSRRVVPSPGRATPGRRSALLIGNNNYSWGPLRNAINDVRALSAAVKTAGFDPVAVVEDAGRAQMQREIRKFLSGLQDGDVALFYYSGHGVQVNGENYLIPVDLNPKTLGDVEDDAISANKLLKQLESAGPSVRVLILDACRDNPLRTTRSAARGLARMEGATGSFIAFATGDGQTADDNVSGGNGLFTASLLQTLKQPGLTLDEIFLRVRRQVVQASSGRQIPTVYTTLLDDFYFYPANVNPPVPARTEYAASSDTRTFLSDFASRAGSKPKTRTLADDEQAFKEILAALPPNETPKPDEASQKDLVDIAINSLRSGRHPVTYYASGSIRGWAGAFLSGLALDGMQIFSGALDSLSWALKTAPPEQFERIRAAMARARDGRREAVANGWLWEFGMPFLGGRPMWASFVLLPGGSCHGTYVVRTAGFGWEASCSWTQTGNSLVVVQEMDDGKKKMARRWEFSGQEDERTGSMTQNDYKSNAQARRLRSAGPTESSYSSAISRAKAAFAKKDYALAYGEAQVAINTTVNGWEAQALHGAASAQLHLFGSAMDSLVKAAAWAPDEEFGPIRDAILTTRDLGQKALERGERWNITQNVDQSLGYGQEFVLLENGSCHMTDSGSYSAPGIATVEAGCKWTREGSAMTIEHTLKPSTAQNTAVVKFTMKQEKNEWKGTWTDPAGKSLPASMRPYFELN